MHKAGVMIEHQLLQSILRPNLRLGDWLQKNFNIIRNGSSTVPRSVRNWVAHQLSGYEAITKTGGFPVA